MGSAREEAGRQLSLPMPFPPVPRAAKNFDGNKVPSGNHTHDKDSRCHLFNVIFAKQHRYLWFFAFPNISKKFELMLTGCAKAYSSSCSQIVSLSPAILSWLLRGYRSLMSSCTGFLKPRKSRLGPSKSTFNAEIFIRNLSLSISIGFATIRSCNVARSRKSPKNP